MENKYQEALDKIKNYGLSKGSPISFTLEKECDTLQELVDENKVLTETLELYNEKFAGHERVKTDLIQENQKLKKAIEIIKSKEVDITYFLYSNSYVFYNFYAIENELEPLSSQEYDLLNEMIHHDEI